MKKLILHLVFTLSLVGVFGQNTDITGTINHYSKVTSVVRCGNRMVVDSPSLFAVGTRALVIQMQGALMNVSNAVTYGNLLSYAAAGNYEIVTIDSILTDTLKFRYQLQRLYDANGSVQIIPLPEYHQATVTGGKLTCRPWNGSVGGVLLLKADSLVLNDSIKVSGLGFRGFYNNDSSQNCFGGTNNGFYFGDSMQGAPKGEGIVRAPYTYGRGKTVNGGGGGNNQNTGGGGGGNFGHGGTGGTIVARTVACPGNDPGIGGLALAYGDTIGKVFMGGGGGCGHGNNSEGTGGTNGGAIVIIMANTLIGNNKGIVSDGIDQTRVAGSDGAGGGGAGGTVLLSVGQYTGSVGIRAKGGIGGSLNNDFLTRSCMGPAGGGGGGVLWVSQAAVPGSISFTAPGGINGKNLANTTFCPLGVTNGALPGDTGGSVTGLVIPESTVPYVRLSAIASGDTLLCNDQQLHLSALGTSSDSVYYAWSTGQAAADITFLATQTATYAVDVTDRNTCTVTKTMDVTVEHVLPAFSGDTAMCSPANITLHADNTGSTPVTYTWNTGATSPSISFLADSTRTYTVTVTSAHSCSATATMHVSVGNLNATFSHDTAICLGQPLTLSVFPAGGAAYSYTWSTGQSTAAISVTPAASTIYTVTVSAGGGCSIHHDINVEVQSVQPAFSADTAICGSGAVTLHADNTTATPVTYAWSTGDGSPSITVSPTSPAVYTVTVSSGLGCSASDTIRVNVGNLRVTFSNDTAICPGQSVMLGTTLLSGNGVHYRWSTGDSTASITEVITADISYVVTVTDDAGCSVDHNYFIRQDYLGVIATDDTTTCPGGIATLSIDVPNVPVVTYAWSTGEATQQVSVTQTSRQVYTVTVSSPDGCSGTASINVYVDSVQIAGAGDTICPTGRAVVYASGAGIGALRFTWSDGSTADSLAAAPAGNTTYTVTATDSLGCTAVATTTVTVDNVYTHLSPQITAIPDSAAAPGDSVRLTVDAAALASYMWSPDSTLTSATTQITIATPQRATYYCVDVIDSSGCSAQACMRIGVGVPPADIALPTAFTPNGDGHNDRYTVPAIDGTVIAHVTIYNRWGETVYEANDNTGWDGTYRGIAQPSEIYTCFVKYYQKIYPEKPFYREGSFTLIR
ncbi:MAG: gliding motility-associated C-terminal domain-containing protein [Bacteroidetes bacterium]|nr:gliding motility-associated C-terminal domain-containing protein [Bacteroidota bacterium]